MANVRLSGKITPCLWFEGNAEEAVKYYKKIFKGTKIGAIARYGDGAPLPKGTVLTMEFTLLGQKFLALNGGPGFKFNEAVSFIINCENQKEIDYYWQKLTSNGGSESMCGWLRDKFGLSWQVVPTKVISKLLSSHNKKAAGSAMQALMRMKKLDIGALEAAYKNFG